MATLPLSFALTTRSHCLNCRSIQIASPSSTNGKRVNRTSLNLDAAKSSRIQYRSFKVVAATGYSAVQTATEVVSYLFRTENGSLVKVFVEQRNQNSYALSVEVSLQTSTDDVELVMNWGIFRSNSSSFLPLNFPDSSSDGTVETRLVQKSSGKHMIEMDFKASLAPFSFSFLFKSLAKGGEQTMEIMSHRKTKFCVPVGFGRGYPAPLGVSFPADGLINFALFSRTAETVVLCLYEDIDKNKPSLEIDLDPYINRSGEIWHASISTDLPFLSYGYKCKRFENGKLEKIQADQVLLDPYAKFIVNGLGKLCKEPAFDWDGDVCPFLPLEELVVYRLNVGNFTKDKSSRLPNHSSGTFCGVSEKLHHFQELGVNAVLLEPIFLFEEKQGPYFPLHFFSPASIYSSSDSFSNRQMKEMVKKLHSNGIEVLLEVVFTHTGDRGALRGIDNSSYHYKDEMRLNCNFPVVQQLILDSLRHWVIEFHVDGFCFVNSSFLLRGFHGENLSRPPLVEAISFDPILSKIKIISDSWDPLDTSAEKVIQFPHWKRWAETNTSFCKDVRNYLRGEGLISNLATRLCGSGDIFLAGRGPAFSFNFIARNSGLSLVDLVSFSNSELDLQMSWNCGEEGATNNTLVLETRLKQIRNFLFILFISLGIPVLNMGDECGQSTKGSPLYVDRKPFNWDALTTGFATQTTHFISFLSSLRVKRSDLLQKRNFLKVENIDWHGSDQSPPSWEDPTTKFLAMTLKADEEEGIKLDSESFPKKGDLFVAFNAADKAETVTMPAPPADMVWMRLVDTALPYPGFFSIDGESIDQETTEITPTYVMKSHSCVLFEAVYITVSESD